MAWTKWKEPGGGAELLRLAWPLILTNSFWAMQMALDRIFLGWAGSDGIGAAMVSAWLFWTPLVLLQNTANYATAFVAQYTGAGQSHRVGAVVWQALHFSVIAGVAFIGLVPLVEPVIALGGHSPQLQEMESTYLSCLCFAALPLLVTAAVSSFFAGRGDSRTVLLIHAIGLTANGMLAYAWIFGRWGFPAWGIAGAGWAMVLGSWASALLGLVLMLRPRFQALYSTGSGWAFDRDLFRRLMRYGIPSGLLAGLDTLAFTLFLFLVGRLGDVELSATSIAFTINLVFILPALGLSQAVGVLVGQRLGEDRPNLAERTTWTGLRITLLYMVLLAIPYLLFPEPLAELFQSEKDVAKWEQIAAVVPVLLRFVALYSLFDAVNLVFSFALRGAGDTRFVTAVAFALSWPVMVVPTWAVWYYDWSLYWAWTFASAYILLLALVFFFRFRLRAWQSMRVIEPELAHDAELKRQDQSCYSTGDNRN